MDRDMSNINLLNEAVEAAGGVFTYTMDTNLCLNRLVQALQAGGGGGGSTSSGDYTVVSDLSDVTSPKEGSIAYVKKHSEAVVCNGIEIEGITRNSEDNGGASIKVDGNGIYDTVYIEYWGMIYTNINSVGIIYYGNDWLEIADGLFVKGESTGAGDTDTKFYVVGDSNYTITVEEMNSDKNPYINSVTLSDVNVDRVILPSVYQYDGSEWVNLVFNTYILNNGWDEATKLSQFNTFKNLYNLGFRPVVEFKNGNSFYIFTKYHYEVSSDCFTFCTISECDVMYTDWQNSGYMNVYGNALSKEIISTIAVNSSGEVYTDDQFDNAVDGFRRNPNGGRALIRLIDDATGYIALAHSVREWAENDIVYRSADFIVDQKLVRWTKNMSDGSFSKQEYDLGITTVNNALEEIIGD